MIKKAEYIKSLVNIKDAPEDDFSHILLLGRSNVGKSSLINAITNRKSLARVSQNPGKTITLNFYLLNDSLYLVDAPGYGYAKRSFSMKEQFLKMIVDFIKADNKLKKIFLLIDFKVGPTKDDLETYHNLVNLDCDLVIVCTKLDKITKTNRPKQIKIITSSFLSGQKIIFTSSQERIGIESIIEEVLNV